MKVLVTGSKGFIGSHMVNFLKRNHHEVFEFDIQDSETSLIEYIQQADWIIHLAGVNRPLTIEEFYDGNTNFTKKLIDLVKRFNPSVKIVANSSIQAELDNDYGKSKRMAEEALIASGLSVYIYRFYNVFGRGCRPNYNSATATFCYNIAHDLDVYVRDPNYVVTYNYVNDICEEILNLIENKVNRELLVILYVKPQYSCSLGKQVELLKYFKKCVQSDEHLPLIHDDFELKLFITFLWYLSDENSSFNFAADMRGSFEELYKSKEFGQISLNMAYPNITKGGHYHTYKKEIFYPVKGDVIIRQRNIQTDEVISNEVHDHVSRINIIPLYTHEITNIGKENSYTLMWISHVYSDETADTIREPFLKEGAK